MQKGIIIGIVILALVAVGGGVWLANQSKTTSQVIPEQSTPVNVMEDKSQKQVAGKVVEISVEGSNFKYTPNKIEVNQGDTVRLTFKSSGLVHDFVIDELDVTTSQIGDGEEEEVEFVVNKKGTFEFYCSVGNHRAMGMKGMLVVN